MKKKKLEVSSLSFMYKQNEKKYVCDSGKKLEKPWEGKKNGNNNNEKRSFHRRTNSMISSTFNGWHFVSMYNVGKTLAANVFEQLPSEE